MMNKDVIKVLKKLLKRKRKWAKIKPPRYDKVYWEGLKWLDKL